MGQHRLRCGLRPDAGRSEQTSSTDIQASTTRFDTYLQERVQAIQATDRDIVLRIYGTNPDELLASGNNVLGILSGIDGVADARVETGATSPEFHVEVDLDKAEKYGLTPGDVRRTATTLVPGSRSAASSKTRRCSRSWSWAFPRCVRARRRSKIS